MLKQIFNYRINGRILIEKSGLNKKFELKVNDSNLIFKESDQKQTFAKFKFKKV
jgi:predicted sulfurtransferase